MTTTDTLALKVEKWNGRYTLTSDDVPGLLLSQADWSRLFLDAPEAIRDLLRLNRGIEW